jgi:hypothetical protein
MVVVLIAALYIKFELGKLISNAIVIKMSQRLGMADGRCFTMNSSAQLFNNYVMKQNGISFEDNYSYRKLLQSQGPQLLSKVQEVQGKQDCNNCNVPLLKMPDVY